MPMRKYEPSERDRQIVLRLGAVANIDLECIAYAITNERTGKPINVKTLKKHYARELRLAKTEMQKIVMDSFVEQLKAGNAQALKIGLNSYCGLRDTGNQITLSADKGNNNIAWQINFVESPFKDEPVAPEPIDVIANPEPVRRLPKYDLPIEPAGGKILNGPLQWLKK